MKRYIEPLKQVSIAEITPGTDMSELFKIVGRYNFLPINLGVETGIDYFHNSDEDKTLEELGENREKIGFKTDLHLNGTNNFWYYNETCRDVLLKEDKPNRVIFNLNTISEQDYHQVVAKGGDLFDKMNCYLLNSRGTNIELGNVVAEFNLVHRGVKFLNYPSDFDNGFDVKMALYGNSADYDWCGLLNQKTMVPALDWIVARYGYSCARVMTRGGVMTDKKTDLIKVGDLLENVTQWNELAKAKQKQLLKQI